MAEQTTMSAIDHAETEEAVPELWSIFRPIFLGWEKLRPFYVLVNFLWCMVFVTGSEPIDGFRFGMICLEGGVVANLCYFAGPILESYVAWLGFRQHRWLRFGLFAIGTLFTMALAASVLSQFFVPLGKIQT